MRRYLAWRSLGKQPGRKTLLVKRRRDGRWAFPGGAISDPSSLCAAGEDACVSLVQQEVRDDYISSTRKSNYNRQTDPRLGRQAEPL